MTVIFCAIPLILFCSTFSASSSSSYYYFLWHLRHTSLSLWSACSGLSLYTVIVMEIWVLFMLDLSCFGFGILLSLQLKALILHCAGLFLPFSLCLVIYQSSWGWPYTAFVASFISVVSAWVIIFFHFLGFQSFLVIQKWCLNCCILLKW